MVDPISQVRAYSTHAFWIGLINRYQVKNYTYLTGKIINEIYYEYYENYENYG